jgi:flagellar basal body-associated protein FliL
LYRALNLSAFRSPTIAAITAVATVTTIAITATATAATTTASATAAAATPAAAAATAATPAAAAATAAAEATAAAATAAATTAAAATRLTFFSFVHANRPTLDERAVQLRDRILRFLGTTHRDETEAARLSAFAIRHNVDVNHFADRSEGGAQCLRRRLKRQVAYIQTITHGSLSRLVLAAQCLS